MASVVVSGPTHKIEGGTFDTQRGPVHAGLRMKVYPVVTALGVILAGSGTTADPELVTPDELTPSQGATIAKTVVSSRLRLIFFVGLEGSGHHFAREAFEGVFEDHDDLQEVDECNITSSIYVPQALNGTAAHYRKKRESLRLEMNKLAALEKGLQAPGSFLTVQRTNRAQIKRCGKGPEYSYPNGHGPNKALAFADLQLLAELAEEEGVDFRILYLQRSAKDLLLSDISHRHFHK